MCKRTLVLWLLAALVLVACAPAAFHGPAGAWLPAIVHYDTRNLARLHFTPVSLVSLGETWVRAQAEQLEDAACLRGRIALDTLLIEGLVRAEVVERTPHRIAMTAARGGQQGCSDLDFIGGAHTHLVINGAPSSCAPSPDDLLTFWADTRAVLLAVICFASLDGAKAEVVLFWVVRDGRFGQTMFRGTTDTLQGGPSGL